MADNKKKEEDKKAQEAAAAEAQGAANEAVEQEEDNAPVRVRLRESHEFFDRTTKQRALLAKGREITSQDYDLDLLMQQGAKLDLLGADGSVEGDLNALLGKE